MDNKQVQDFIERYTVETTEELVQTRTVRRALEGIAKDSLFGPVAEESMRALTVAVAAFVEKKYRENCGR